jgi:transposase
MNELIEYYNSDHTLPECAIKFNCHENTIRRNLRKFGIDTSKYNGSKRVKIDTNELIEYSKNHNMKECAEKFDLKIGVVRSRLRDLGIDTSKLNTVKINNEELTEYFKNHSLKECSEKFNCSEATIKRTLKELNVDTSIHNNSKLAYEKFLETRKDTSILTKEFLIEKFINENMDTKTLSEQLGLSYSLIRKKVQEYGLKKSLKNVSVSMSLRHLQKTGYWHPGQRPDVIKKINSCKSRFGYKSSITGREYLFKSLHELCFALLLDKNENVENWDYELISVPYIHRLTGKQKLYYVDFSVQYKDGNSKWFEIKPCDNMIPDDKRLYAMNAAKQINAVYSGIDKETRDLGYKLFCDGYNYDNINFKNKIEILPHRTYTYWFKNISDIENIIHDHYMYRSDIGKYYKCKFVSKTKNKNNSI